MQRGKVDKDEMRRMGNDLYTKEEDESEDSEGDLVDSEDDKEIDLDNFEGFDAESQKNSDSDDDDDNGGSSRRRRSIYQRNIRKGL